MTEKTYRMGDELIPESGMAQWHNDRGQPWGATYNGPEPMTVSAQVPAGNITVHLGNQHGISPTRDPEANSHAHLVAHRDAVFRPGQGHYHRPYDYWRARKRRLDHEAEHDAGS